MLIDNESLASILSAVLDKNILEAEYCPTSNSTILLTVIPESIAYRTDERVCGYWLNLHDLINKCKLWLVNETANNLEIVISQQSTSVGYYLQQEADWVYTHGTTEPEAILKTCEWILKDN